MGLRIIKLRRWDVGNVQTMKGSYATFSFVFLQSLFRKIR